jgi:putative NADH-flavin reductase
MKITIFGATGSVGSRVVAEALSRDHEVRAVVRHEGRFKELPDGVEPHIGDVTHSDDVARLSVGQDLVISATRPAPGHESLLIAMTQALLAGLSGTGIRLLLVGGAGGLIVPGSDGRMAVNDPNIVPPPWRAIAEACVEQYEVCRAATHVDWTYLSPPALLVPGERTGHYRLGADELLFDVNGRSTISIEDFAVALLDEAEQPHHQRSRFTVAY